MNKMRIFGIFLLISISLQACGSLPVSNTQPATVLPVQTEEPVVTVPSATPEVTVAPTSAEPTAIQHLVQPDAPTYIDTQSIRDCVMEAAFAPGQEVIVPQSCDFWDIDFVERPFSSDKLNYYPYLDVLYAKFGANKDWIFARIDLINATLPAEHGDIYYMIEFDLDFDNISDVLVEVENLKPIDVLWTVNNLHAWRFENGSVVSIFDQGVGDDPDALWVRRSSTELTTTIEFAFKPSLLGGDTTFAWWVWTYEGEFDPALFIPLDLMPDGYLIDNTCAMGFNGNAINLLNTCRDFNQ